MDGLVVESASPQAWTILSKGAFAFLTIPDTAAVDAMQQAAGGVEGDYASSSVTQGSRDGRDFWL